MELLEQATVVRLTMAARRTYPPEYHGDLLVDRDLGKSFQGEHHVVVIGDVGTFAVLRDEIEVVK